MVKTGFAANLFYEPLHKIENHFEVIEKKIEILF